MKEHLYRSLRILPSLLVAMIFIAIPTAAQDDPNPNSPTPVLLSASDSSHVLAVDPSANLRRRIPRTAPPMTHSLNGKAVLFVTNVSLMKGEGHTAFRVYAEDGLRHLYR